MGPTDKNRAPTTRTAADLHDIDVCVDFVDFVADEDVLCLVLDADVLDFEGTSGGLLHGQSDILVLLEQVVQQSERLGGTLRRDERVRALPRQVGALHEVEEVVESKSANKVDDVKGIQGFGAAVALDGLAVLFDADAFGHGGRDLAFGDLDLGLEAHLLHHGHFVLVADVEPFVLTDLSEGETLGRVDHKNAADQSRAPGENHEGKL